MKRKRTLRKALGMIFFSSICGILIVVGSGQIGVFSPPPIPGPLPWPEPTPPPPPDYITTEIVALELTGMGPPLLPEQIDVPIPSPIPPPPQPEPMPFPPPSFHIPIPVPFPEIIEFELIVPPPRLIIEDILSEPPPAWQPLPPLPEPLPWLVPTLPPPPSVEHDPGITLIE